VQEADTGGVQRRWAREDTHSAGAKRRPRVAGGGENIPLEITRSMSTWMAALEERGTVPGTTMGTMIGTVAAFEDSLSSECLGSPWGWMEG
jgi:putative membrane protein